MQYIDLFDEVHAAQLLIEVLAMGLTGVIMSERQKLGGTHFLSGVETNPVVLDAVRWVIDSVPKLDSWAKAVREMPHRRRERCFSEAFNELLLSCGRAHAVKVTFRVLEWMEALAVPKNSFTYEAIGVNVVKRITRLEKVWDLPQAPEDEVCPEVVFAGRSNVGKSSLVNMMLNRNALAPTSSR
ncbi:engB, partial [Symbiodinium natans]